MALVILGWGTFSVGALLVFAGMWWIRQEIQAGGSVTYGVICSNVFYFSVTLGVLIIGYSPFHLLWLFPLSFVLGFLTLVSPFSAVLIPLARIYSTLCSLGLDEVEIKRNEKRIKQIQELMVGGVSRDEAVRQVIDEEEQQET